MSFFLLVKYIGKYEPSVYPVAISENKVELEKVLVACEAKDNIYIKAYGEADDLTTASVPVPEITATFSSDKERQEWEAQAQGYDIWTRNYGRKIIVLRQACEIVAEKYNIEARRITRIEENEEIQYRIIEFDQSIEPYSVLVNKRAWQDVC